MRPLLVNLIGNWIDFFSYQEECFIFALQKPKPKQIKDNFEITSLIFQNFPNYYLFNYRVTVYNVSKLFPWDRQLASKYTVWKADPVKGGLISEGILILVRSSIRLTK
jgi:hypothetical protein